MNAKIYSKKLLANSVRATEIFIEQSEENAIEYIKQSSISS